MTARAVWAIGAGQLVNWGVLYYAFSVLLIPVAQELDRPRWLVAGAFSLALLTSAIVAPVIGRLADRGQGPVALQAGGLLAAVFLVSWAALPNIWITYVAWAGLGVCMGAILYEPVFAIVGRAFVDADARLRAIATITVMGGLASTAFVPATAILVEALGWRTAVLALAAALIVTTVAVAAVSFQNQRWSLHPFREAVAEDSNAGEIDAPERVRTLCAVFAVSSLVNAAISSNLVAALIDRGLPAAAAAAIAGTFGVMQLPGRVLMTDRRFTPSPMALLASSFALQIVSLAVLAFAGTASWIVACVLLFAVGAGLTTLARPYLVLQRYGAGQAGVINGSIARWQQLARAGGPVGAAAMAVVWGYPVVFGALASLLTVAVVIGVRSHTVAS